MGSDADLNYLLRHYKLARAVVPKTVDLNTLGCVVEGQEGRTRIVQFAGGIDSRLAIRRLNDGSIGVLRDIVVAARPSPDALTWPLDLRGWNPVNSADLEVEARGPVSGSKSDQAARPDRGGSSFHEKNIELGPSAGTGGKAARGFSGFGHLTNPTGDGALRDLGGVDIRVRISEASFSQSKGGRLDKVEQEGKRGRRSHDTLSWPEKQETRTGLPKKGQ